MPQPANSVGPLLLALDTSTEQASLALYDGDLIAEQSWPASRSARRGVAPEVMRLLTLAGRSVGAVTVVGVALGPGSFSALRVGVSLAKGLVYAARCALVAVPTLDVVSYAHRQAGQPVWAVLQPGRGRVVGARYPVSGDDPYAAEPLYHGTVAGLVDRIAGPAIVAGEVPSDMIAALADRPGVVVPPPALRYRRASVLAEIAWARWKAGQTEDPFTLEPLYLHGDGGGERAVLP